MSSEQQKKIEYLGIGGVALLQCTESCSNDRSAREAEWSGIMSNFRFQNEGKNMHFIPYSYSVPKTPGLLEETMQLESILAILS